MSDEPLVAREAERRNERGWTVFPPAKLNLSLEILGRREDGYHELRTELEPIDLTDRLTVDEHAGPLTLTSSDPSLPTDRRNLVVRAAEAYGDRVGRSPRVRMHLEKRIPAGAGLGGGSSDAAATLWVLDRLSGGLVGDEELMSLAAELGSDIPFFLGAGRAIGSGRGEILRPRPAVRVSDYVLLWPRFSISSQDVYRNLRSSLIWEYGANRIETLQDPPFDSKNHSYNHEQEARNDLGPVACRVCPSLAKTWHQCEALGIGSFHLTGSGSTLFTRQASRSAAQRVAGELRRRDLGDVFVVRNLF